MTSASAAIDLNALYSAHSDWLCAWLSRRTRCRHRAADLAQDTFCRLLESPASASPRDPRSYLATVARRILVDDIRRREVERAVLDACAARDVGVDLLTPERIAQAVQLLEAVSLILETMPEEARTAFLLRRIEGLEQQEIALRLGVSLSTVKRHIAMAYARCYAVAYSD